MDDDPKGQEIRVEVRTFRVVFRCFCGGDAKSTGTMQTSRPPKYAHVCPKCKERYWLDKQYPFIEYGDKVALVHP